MTGRLVFTLFDVRGRPIAFAGRRLPPDESGAKYVNSPESPLWHKGSTLYGLHLARTAIARGEEAIVVEGYTDVIGLVQAGYENVVASMGTALTQPQLRELRKLARNVVLLFDADTAGSEAALRGLELAASEDLRVRVALPPRGSDPGRGRRGGPRGRRSHARRAPAACSPSASRSCSTRPTSAAPAGATRPTRRCAAIFRDAPATPERDELVRKAGSRLFLDPVHGIAARLASASAGERPRPSRRRACACRWTPPSATSGCCSRSRSRAGERGLATLERVPPEALTHEELREAHAWVRARLNQDDVPSVEPTYSASRQSSWRWQHGTGGRRRSGRWRAASSRVGSNVDWNPSRRSSPQPR